MRQIVPAAQQARRDRMKLLAQQSPPDSPKSSFEDTRTPVKGAPIGRYEGQTDGTVKFVPSPADTEPMTSPEGSFASTPSPQQAPQQGGKKMGRFASLFSSRASVNQGSQPVAASPAGSDASSSYVNWPGTQDKRGATVAMELNYGDGKPVRDYENTQVMQHARFEDSESSESGSDYRLSAAVVNSAAAASSPMAKQSRNPSDHDKVHRLAKPQVLYSDPWNRNQSDETMSGLSNAYSQTSSAYFNPNEVRAVRGGKVDHVQEFGKKKQAAASVMRLTEEALAQRDHYAPPHRTFNSTNGTGYTGLLDKTKEIPNLMDDTSSLATSMSGAASQAAKPARQQQRSSQMQIQDDIPEEPASKDDEDDYVYTDPYKQTGGNLNVVLLGGGLTTIQTTAEHFSNRKTARDYDEELTNSDIDDYGNVRIPGFHEMVSAGRNDYDKSYDSQSAVLFSEYTLRAKDAIERYRQNRNNENSNPFNSGSDSGSGSSLFSDPYKKEGFGGNVARGLDQYYIHPDEMKVVVKKFRKMSSMRSPNLNLDEYDREEDATKAFALSEMRSRIMEKDIERGLERRGGTTVVDDIVLTDYNKTAMRVRDACIVAKAWRDGATPLDVINTSMLTQRAERSYFIPRLLNAGSGSSPDYKYAWEEVLWFDDLELSQYRCHSLGPRSMRGYEMFTIGDCQSIQLKLCNERCNELKKELNDATQRLIEAEDWMREEGGEEEGMMTEAEMTYLSSMEAVKTVSRQLVIAEKSFTLVKDRIEKLVARYEALLVKLDNDNVSCAASSVVSYQSSYVSDWTAVEEREREQMSRRAQRAELRAEVAAREAMLSKPGARVVRADKEKELSSLRNRLAELQSETSAAITEREHSVVLARAIHTNKSQASSSKMSSSRAISKSKIDDVKARFRNRAAAKQQNPNGDNRSVTSSRSSSFQRRPMASSRERNERSTMYRSVGEEMYQQLDFYERSLQAVDSTR